MRRFVASLFIGLGLLLLWQLLANASTPDVLPGPAPVWASFVRALQDGSLLDAIGATAQESAVGWLIAAVIAIPAGYFIGRYQVLEDTLAPYLAGSVAMPVVAISPLLLIWIGPGLWAIVAVCTLISFFPMLASTASGVRGVPREAVDAGRVFGANGWYMAWLIYLPLAARTMFSGIKVGAALSVTGAVVGEFVAPEQGLGFLVSLGSSNFDPSLKFVAVITLILMGAAAYGIAGLAERLVLRWDRDT
jgi:NitT/TauT family transport system permease protein